jgi:hypothetical protein
LQQRLTIEQKPDWRHYAQVKEFIKYLGGKFEVTWSNGCLYEKSVKLLGGLLYESTITSCEPGCAKCKVTGAIQVGLAIVPDMKTGVNGLNISDQSKVTDLHNGLLH